MHQHDHAPLREYDIRLARQVFPAQPEPEAHVVEYAADPNRRLLVVEANGTPAGYAMVNFERTSNADVLALVSTPNTVELVTFYLLAGRQGSGLADMLMDAALAEARESGADSVWLGVADQNSRANSFYERYRFTRRGTKTFMVGSAALIDLIRERTL